MGEVTAERRTGDGEVPPDQVKRGSASLLRIIQTVQKSAVARSEVAARSVDSFSQGAEKRVSGGDLCAVENSCRPGSVPVGGFPCGEPGVLDDVQPARVPFRRLPGPLPVLDAPRPLLPDLPRLGVLTGVPREVQIRVPVIADVR